MRNLLLGITVLFAATSSAQNNITLKQLVVPGIKVTTTIDSIPNALPVKPFDGKKMGNNGQGFDVYKAKPDNMPVLMPDSTNHEKMPNGMGKINPGSVNLELLRKLYEEKKDSTFNLKMKKGFSLIKPNNSYPSSDSIEAKIRLLPSLPR